MGILPVGVTVVHLRTTECVGVACVHSDCGCVHREGGTIACSWGLP